MGRDFRIMGGKPESLSCVSVTANSSLVLELASATKTLAIIDVHPRPKNSDRKDNFDDIRAVLQVPHTGTRRCVGSGFT